MKIRTIRKITGILTNKFFWIGLFLTLLVLFVIITFLFQTVPFFRGIVSTVDVILQKVYKVLTYPLFSIGGVEVSLFKFFIFIFIFYVGLLIGKYYKFGILKLKKKYPDISPSIFTILAKIGYYIIVIIVLLSSIKVIGIDLSSLSLIVGALSVGIGFGLQNIVSNFISGIILMFEQTIKIGDYIELDNGIRGTVINISLRSLTIKTNDNIDLVIPNQKFIENNIINWTLNDNKVRFKIPFGVAYGTKIKDVEKIILQALKNSKLDFYLKSGDYIPRIIMKQMGDSSIDFELYVWIKGKHSLTPGRTKSDFLKLIYTALNNANINIPFPQQDVYIKQTPEITVKLGKD